MSIEIVRRYLPSDWSYMNVWDNKDYELVEIPSYTVQYSALKAKVQGSFNVTTNKIVRVQNPYLYAQYLLKKEEYVSRSTLAPSVTELFHDTAENKISSIVSSNLDWRYANRVKYGKGVSFSPSPAYANKESSRSNGTNRAMIIADVLVGSTEYVNSSKALPNSGCDTSIGNGTNVYVKYYDNEFYPKYVVFYESKPHVYHRYRGFF